jgi:hypothetical protein
LCSWTHVVTLLSLLRGGSFITEKTARPKIMVSRVRNPVLKLNQCLPEGENLTNLW